MNKFHILILALLCSSCTKSGSKYDSLSFPERVIAYIHGDHSDRDLIFEDESTYPPSINRMLEGYRDWATKETVVDYSSEKLVLPSSPSYISDNDFIYEIKGTQITMHTFSSLGFGGVSLPTMDVAERSLVPAFRKIKIPNDLTNKKYAISIHFVDKHTIKAGKITPIQAIVSYKTYGYQAYARVNVDDEFGTNYFFDSSNSPSLVFESPTIFDHEMEILFLDNQGEVLRKWTGTNPPEKLGAQPIDGGQ